MKYQCFRPTDGEVREQARQIEETTAQRAAEVYSEQLYWEKRANFDPINDAIELVLIDETGVEYEATVDLEFEVHFDAHVMVRDPWRKFLRAWRHIGRLVNDEMKSFQ